MSKRNDFKLDLISRLDDGVVDKATEKRINLLATLKKKNIGKRLVIVLVAAVLLLATVGGGLLVALFGGGEDLPEPTEPFQTDPLPTDPAPTEPVVPVEKQIPVYEGMTVSNEAPVTSTLSIKRLASKKVIDQKNPFGKGEGHRHIEDEIKDTFIYAEGAPAEYFAKKNQDIYIIIHVSNPDNFEIQSFTLNGKKYANYMFEPGSDMETLILKYNVGDVEGVQEYTLDAIKYIDGEEIKDVKMEGDRTVRVNITPDDQPTIAVSSVAIDFTSITLTATLTDPENLVSASEGKLYIVLYDGEELIVNQEITSGTPVTLSDLNPDTVYQYAIIGEYDAIDGQGYAAHILSKVAFATEQAVNIEIQTNGWMLKLTPEWNSEFSGETSFTSLAVYNDIGKLAELDVDDTSVEVSAGESVYVVATYKIGEKTYTYTSQKIEMPLQSEGLAITEGVITGIGSCGDSVLYLNMPIAQSAFQGVDTIEKVHLGNGVKKVGAYAFADSTIKECVFYNGPYILEEKVFYVSGNYLVTGVEKIHITDLEAFINMSIHNYGKGFLSTSGIEVVIDIDLYYNGELLKDLVIPEGVQTIKSEAIFLRNTQIESISLPSTFNGGDRMYIMFGGCENLKNITVAEDNPLYYSDGNCVIEKETDTLIFAPCDLTTLPSSVKKIANNGAFSNVSSTTLTIPDGVTGDLSLTQSAANNNVYYAGVNGENIETLNVGNGIERVFVQNARKLKTVNLGSSVNSISFSGCSALESFVIPDSVTSFIGWGPFANCTSLKEVTIGKGISSLGSPTNLYGDGASAFSGCTNLTTVYIKNRDLSYIGNYTFGGCTKLETINFDGTSGEWSAIEKYTTGATPWNYGVNKDCIVNCKANNQQISAFE